MGSRGHYSEEMDLIHYHHLSATFSSQPGALTGLVWSHIILELGAVLVVTLEVDDLLLPHFGIIKIPITTVKVTL